MQHTLSMKKNSAFRQVYRQGRQAANRLLVLYALPNNTAFNRLGITVGKKVGNAVVRNRVKRLIREQYRLSEAVTVRGYDLVFVARAAAGVLVKPDAFIEVGRAMRYLLYKQNLINRL